MAKKTNEESKTVEQELAELKEAHLNLVQRFEFHKHDGAGCVEIRHTDGSVIPPTPPSETKEESDEH